MRDLWEVGGMHDLHLRMGICLNPSAPYVTT